ncbi:MAG: glutamyl-tRNA amidotransferase [delta proteobacterium MLS_D]|jgi:aspartyl-tRNA(Asn)/glutamyl-tRNA(Gln) amidotransferase subunit C|nr:MAG: glutamyl-tRNA amidotransferase [delta proteobacterium MLS_D]
MKITEDQVAHVAHLARLNIDEKEREVFTKQLDDILLYIDMLNSVDTTDVAPMTHAMEGTETFREDVVRSSLPVDAALANAPDDDGASFKVPKVIE